MEKKYNAPAADGVLEVLEFLVENPGAWGPTELNRQLGTGTNLIFRVLNALAEHGYVKRNEAGKYELGAKLFSLGMRLHSRFELRTCARPFLQRLAAETGETCQLQVPDGDRMLSVDCIYPACDYYLAVNPGAHLHYHCNAFGKAVLAFRSEPELREFFRKPLEPMTPHTIVSEELLRRELREIRKTRVATEFDEYLTGGYCIGSPVFDASGNVVAGIGISALSSRRTEENTDYFKNLVRQCAEEITKSTGGVLPPVKKERTSRDEQQ